MGSISTPLFLVACSLIATLLFALSISKKKKEKKRVKLGINANYLNKKRTMDLRCRVCSSYLIAT